MNADFFLKFSKFKLGSLVSAEDMADKLNYQYSTFIMILFVALVGIRQYIFTPIQCWIPHEWARSWEEYAENLCWVENTYYADTIDGPPSDIDARKRLRINYYQWVPFMLSIQCLMFYAPHLLWKVGSARIGTHVNHLVRFASEASTFDQDKRAKLIGHVSKEIHKVMDYKQDNYRRTGPWLKVKQQVGRYVPIFIFGKRSGFLLIILYIGVKALYIVNCFLQLAIMQSFIQAESMSFGFAILRNVTMGRSWMETGAFPRVTWCDVQRKTIANSQLNSFMCVLPVNMLNEKIYIFLWFWVVFCLILTIISMITWLQRMFNSGSKRIFIKKYLRILEVMDDDSDEDERLAHVFVNEFLRQDGLFLLFMISQNAGEIVAAEVVSSVWKLWKEKRNELSSKMIGNGDIEQPLMKKSSTLGSRKGSIFV